jgi:hypothetical protein
LWAGTVELAHGAIPIRDFYSYDPGRYLWTAALSFVAGDGILALRASVALFAVLGLFCGLRAAQRVVRSELMLVVVGVVLVIWSFPRHKLFESAIAMMGVLVGVRLLEAPSVRRFFDAGAMVGVATVFGKNHGLYLAFAFLILIGFVFLRVRPRVAFGRAVGALGAGVFFGLLPLLVMFVFVPGFASSYVEFIRYLMAQGRTNVPVPVPWPWAANESGRFVLGAALVLAPAAAVFLVASAVWPFGSKKADSASYAGAQCLALAGGAVGLLYMHHTFSRAGVSHLAQGIHPILLGLVALPGLFDRRRMVRVGIAVLVSLFTIRLAIPQNPLSELARAEGSYRWTSVAGDRLLLPANVVESVEDVRTAVARHVPRDRRLLVLPWYPGMYPLLGRRPPVWDIYPVWLDRRGADRRMIAEIERHRVEWLLAGSFDRREFSFRQTHRTVAKYLDERFVRVKTLSHGFRLFRRGSRAGP